MEILFLSDLHLDPSRPRQLARFRELLKAAATRATALYILGDLFEIWVGDDHPQAPAPEVEAALAAYSGSGGALYLLRGNRDFLLGPRFAKRVGGHLLPDAVKIDLGGAPALLMHGDALCTSDHAYQWYRRAVDNPLFKGCFLALPKSWRSHLASAFRRRLLAHRATLGKPQRVDVEQATVAKVMTRHQVRILIHGHVHHPGHYRFELPGGAAQRWVLGDWYQGDSLLLWRNGELRLAGVSDYLVNTHDSPHTPPQQALP